MKKMPAASPCWAASMCRSFCSPDRANPMFVRSMNEMMYTTIATGMRRVHRERPTGAGRESATLVTVTSDRSAGGRAARSEAGRSGRERRGRGARPSRLPPGASVREGVLLERLPPDLGAVPGQLRREVAPVPHPHRIDEVLVQVVDVFHDDVVEAARDGHEVERAHVLHELAEPHSTGVRAHRHPVLGREQEYSDDLVDAA